MKNPSLTETRPLEKRGFALICRWRIGLGWLRLRQRGFALVTTLILMILITVIAVGMLTLSSISLRSSNLATNQAQARANAKLALMIAIGELQKNVGPDQAATAQATILVAGPKGDANFPAPDGTDPSREYLTGSNSVKNPHWLGVFPTYEPDASDPLVRNKPWIRRPIDFNESLEEYLYDARYSLHTLAAKSDVDRARHAEWMVSKPNTNIKLNPATMTPLALLGTKDDFAALTSNGPFRGPLLFPATTSAIFNLPLANPLDAPALATIEARAPIVAVRNKNGALNGSYAYMAVDNSQRFKLSLSNAEHQTSSKAPSLSDGKTLAQLHSPQNIHLEGLWRNGQADGRLNQLASGPDTKAVNSVTLATVPLQSTNTSFATQPSTNFTPFYQHSFTTEGYGLLVNPITGGLKRNLTSYLERPSQGSEGNEQIAPITSSGELGAAASSVVPDGVYDTASMLAGAGDAASAAIREKITWYAPVMGLLRDYVQLRNKTINPSNDLRLNNPEVSSKPPAQAESALAAFSPLFGGYSVKNALPALAWKTGIGTPYVAGSGAKPNLAPGLGVHPVLLNASANFYPAYNSGTGQVTHLVIPRVILHNPYNAKIKPQKYVVNILFNNNSFLHTSFDFKAPDPADSTKFITKSSNVLYSWTGYNQAGSVWNFPGIRGDLTFVIDNQSGMNPGETLLFCPDVSQGVNVKSSKYAELQFSSTAIVNKDISKNVLSESVDPADGTAFYVREDTYNPKFQEWTVGSDVTSTMSWINNTSYSNQQQHRLVQFYQPSASANLSAGLMHSELKKYSLLQMIYPVNFFEDKQTGGNYSLGSLSKSQIPDLAGGGPNIESFDKRLLNFCVASGARVLKDQESAGGLVNTYPLFAQHDLRAPYVGPVWSLTQEGAGLRGGAPRGNARPHHVGYWGAPIAEWWSLAFDSPTADAFTDPLHVDNDAPFRDAPGRAGINVLHAYSKTGPGNLGGDELSTPMFELPRNGNAILSLASLRHAPINTHFGGPSYTIASSRGTRMAPRSATAGRWNPTLDCLRIVDAFVRRAFSWTSSSSPSGAGQATNYAPFHYQYYDYSFEANHGLYDRFFLTGIEGDPSASQTANTLPSSSADSALLAPDAKLPNPRLLVSGTNQKPASKADVLGYYTAAEKLIIDGAFNVNCTDPLAWQALLSSFRELDVPRSAGGPQEAGQESSYPRLLTSITTSAAKPGGISGSNSIWQQSRSLTDEQIERLSLLIVEQVKRRAPFVSVSDFVNRRLLGGDPSAQQIFGPFAETEFSKLGLSGPLQSAIDGTNINAGTATGAASATTAVAPGLEDAYTPATQGVPNKYADALGFLNQGDLLEKIGSVLTVRGDSFTIRAYGDARDASGKILAQARCEAAVQRVPDYLNSAADSLPQAPYASLQSALNKSFGRRFLMTSFRWLGNNE